MAEPAKMFTRFGADQATSTSDQKSRRFQRNASQSMWQRAGAPAALRSHCSADQAHLSFVSNVYRYAFYDFRKRRSRPKIGQELELPQRRHAPLHVLKSRRISL